MQWIFFDLGNTLLEEFEGNALRNAQLMRMLNAAGRDLTAVDFDQAMCRAAAERAPRLIARALELLAVGPEERAALLDQARYDRSLERPYPGVRDLLRKASATHRMGVIANQPAGTESHLRHLGLWPFFSLCLSSTEEGLSKPDPALFALALQRARCDAAAATMVGDRIDNDIVPARQAGWRTIRVLQGYARHQQPRTSEEEADHVVHRIDEVGQALGL